MSSVVTVTTAQALTSEQKQQVKDIAARALKISADQISLKYQVDAEIIGGIKITAGSKEFDASTKSKLLKVRSLLYENAAQL